MSDEHQYPNEKQRIHFDVLGLCGCGTPVEAYNFCRAFVYAHKFDEKRERQWPQDLVEAMVLENPKMAAHVLQHFFNKFDLLQHGGSVNGSWPTEIGDKFIALGDMTDEEMSDDGFGYLENQGYKP